MTPQIVVLVLVGLLASIAAWKAIDGYLFIVTKRTEHLSHQVKLMEEYEALATKFMRATSELDVPTIRSSIAFMPEIICDSKLAVLVFFTKSDKTHSFTKKDEKRIHSEINKLDEKTLTLLSKLLGCGLVASTFSLPILGVFVRRVMMSSVDKKSKQVGSPERVVVKLSTSSRNRANNERRGELTAA